MASDAREQWNVATAVKSKNVTEGFIELWNRVVANASVDVEQGNISDRGEGEEKGVMGKTTLGKGEQQDWADI